MALAAAVEGQQDAAGREVVGAERAVDAAPAAGDGDCPVGGHREALDRRRVPVAGRPEPQRRAVGQRVFGTGLRGGDGRGTATGVAGSGFTGFAPPGAPTHPARAAARGQEVRTAAAAGIAFPHGDAATRGASQQVRRDRPAGRESQGRVEEGVSYCGGSRTPRLASQSMYRPRDGGPRSR